jgi:hypothetical protein
MIIKGLTIEYILLKISPRPSFPKRGIVPPFGKGRSGGILQINVLIILRLLINK